MEMRRQILLATRRLTLAEGAIPSLDVVAKAAGVSKGGLIHHFPTRHALVEGLGKEALAEVDAAMDEAAAHGRAAQTWLRLSVPRGPQREVYLALVIAYQAMRAQLTPLLAEAAVMTTRWEAMIAAELGDSTQARVVRLVGDGLIANAMLAPDLAPDDAQIDELLAAITDGDAHQ